MGKFGGFGGGKIGGFVSKASSVASKAVSKAENKVGSMSPEEMTSLMEKATPGNAAQWLGGKAGLKLDAGKIDGVYNRYMDAKSKISSTVLNGLLGSIEKVGYKINLPDGEKLANYMMDNDLIGKIDTISNNLNLEDLDKTVKNMDIPKIASEIGLSIEKVPKIESQADADSTLSGKAKTMANVMSGIGEVAGGSFGEIKNEIGTAFYDIKTIVKEKNEND